MGQSVRKRFRSFGFIIVVIEGESKQKKGKLQIFVKYSHLFYKKIVE